MTSALLSTTSTLLMFSSLFLSGCGATAGRQWMRARIDEPTVTSAPRQLTEDEYRVATTPQRRVIRLGESELVDTPRPSSPAGTAVAQGPTTITQTTNVYVTQPTYFGGYGYGYGYSTYPVRGAGVPVVSSTRTEGSAAGKSNTVRPGGNFPAIADHGPPMLTVSGPATAPYFR